jgi:DNA-binding CsgD family transcriptional regulator
MSVWDELKPREREILDALISTDGSIMAVGRVVFLSPPGVKYHLRAIYNKTGCHSRVALAVAYVRATECSES